MTDWDVFAKPDVAALRTMRRPLVIDGVGVTEKTPLADVEHVVMGRGDACAK